MAGFIAEVRTGDGEAAVLEARLVARRLERELAADLDRDASGERRRLAELWNAVDRDLRRRWTVGDLAAVLHVSPATLFRLCARHAGMRPMGQVARLRMERAGQLLRHSDEPVKAVARLVGYGDASSFSTAYRRHTGRSPERDRR
jgi:transcriptional regulator GlxA family with amidase domain